MCESTTTERATIKLNPLVSLFDGRSKATLCHSTLDATSAAPTSAYASLLTQFCFQNKMRFSFAILCIVASVGAEKTARGLSRKPSGMGMSSGARQGSSHHSPRGFRNLQMGMGEEKEEKEDKDMGMVAKKEKVSSFLNISMNSRL